MIVSPNKIIGSLIYRTRKGLNGNSGFVKSMLDYEYSGNLFVNNEFSLWHYPGTNNEISNILLGISKHPKGALVKFPSIFNFHPIRQEKREDITLHYNLAIVCLVDSTWTTEQRESQVFDRVLRPIYEEFMKQVELCNYFIKGYGNIPHTYYEIFTTGGNAGEIMDRYGDYIDAIEIHDLTVTLNSRLCQRDLILMEEENNLVTSHVSELLNSKKNDRTNRKQLQK